MEMLVLDSFREPWLYLGYFQVNQDPSGGTAPHDLWFGDQSITKLWHRPEGLYNLNPHPRTS